MTSHEESIAGNDEQQTLSMPRVVATLQLLLAARRAARTAQRQEFARDELRDEIAA